MAQAYVDPNTGLPIDPNTGYPYDPTGFTGATFAAAPPPGVDASALVPGKKKKNPKAPKHGQTSKTVMWLGSIALLLGGAACFSPNWRANFMGLPLYPYRRSWGLFSVWGQSHQFHHTQAAKSCEFGKLKLGNLCSSPICQWYMLKCQTYFEMAIASYCCGFFFLVSIVLNMCCLYWLCKFTPRTIRWSANWFWLSFFLQIATIVAWFVLTQSSFDALNEKAMYPDPTISSGGIMALFSAVCLGTCAILGMSLKRMWPEEEDSDDDSDEEDSDEDEDEAQKYQKQPAYDPAYDASGQGYGYGSPGYGSPGYDQQGYDPRTQAPYDPNSLDPNLAPDYEAYATSVGADPYQQPQQPTFGGGSEEYAAAAGTQASDSFGAGADLGKQPSVPTGELRRDGTKVAEPPSSGY